MLGVVIMGLQDGECCSEIKVVADRTEKLDKWKDKHEEIEHRDLWHTINGIRNRLPNWAVLVITVLVAALGWASGRIKL